MCIEISFTRVADEALIACKPILCMQRSQVQLSAKFCCFSPKPGSTSWHRSGYVAGRKNLQHSLSTGMVRMVQEISLHGVSQVQRLIQGGEVLAELGAPLPLSQLARSDREEAFGHLRTLLGGITRSNPPENRFLVALLPHQIVNPIISFALPTLCGHNLTSSSDNHPIEAKARCGASVFGPP